MPSFRSLVLLHGYSFLFCYVFAVQAGVPIPSDPVLLIMGAAVGDGRYSFWVALMLTVLAALLGDFIWYELGHWRGRSVIKLMCKFSLEPDTCVRKAELGYMKRGAWTLLFTKFIPGTALITVPLAGAVRMPRWRFVLADATGAALWSTAYLLTGVLLHRQVDNAIILLGLFGRRAGFVLALLLGSYIAWRYFQRVRFRRQLRIDRMSPREAYAMMSSHPPPVIVDLRIPAEVERTGKKIAGAQVLRPAELRTHFGEIPDDREVILYCT
ncbi:MAG: VTT domain-containing protein [Acidobacteriaceae bacterium]|nr:VTT domain-containing protein [Acidobacteriaceae bacterium]